LCLWFGEHNVRDESATKLKALRQESACRPYGRVDVTIKMYDKLGRALKYKIRM
jgi:hypothetical protein